jgi:hypothetical protein
VAAVLGRDGVIDVLAGPGVVLVELVKLDAQPHRIFQGPPS